MKNESFPIDAVIDSQYPEMTVEGRNHLMSLLVRKDLKKGELLYDEGDVCKEIVLVAKGFLRQFYFKNKHDVTEHFSYEGCVLMCIESLFKQEPTYLMAEALEDSMVYLLPMQVIQGEIQTSWEMNTFYRKVLEYSLLVSQAKADTMRFESASDRYRKLMAQQPEIIKRAPMAYIASYLLMTPETLSRVRAQI
jgi:CRP-like cAMP-binding protein